MMQLGAFIFGGMLAYQYTKKYKRIPINNTDLHRNVLFALQRN